LRVGDPISVDVRILGVGYAVPVHIAVGRVRGAVSIEVSAGAIPAIARPSRTRRVRISTVTILILRIGHPVPVTVLVPIVRNAIPVHIGILPIGNAVPIQIPIRAAAAVRRDPGERLGAPAATRPFPCSPEHPGEGEAHVVDLTGAKRGAIFDRGVANRLQLTAALQGLLRAR
jgi:hypothetical protein